MTQAQAVSGSLLATRRRLQAELTACASEFNSEASAHRAVSEALRAQRARLRTEAVELGRTLQACVSRGDELVSENLQLRTESAELEDAEALGPLGRGLRGAAGCEARAMAPSRSRSPRGRGGRTACRGAPGALLKEPRGRGFCGTLAACEFGRDEEYCNSSCYINAGGFAACFVWLGDSRMGLKR